LAQVVSAQQAGELAGERRIRRVHGRREGAALKLWARDHDGWLTMDAEATLR